MPNCYDFWQQTISTFRSGTFPSLELTFSFHCKDQASSGQDRNVQSCSQVYRQPTQLYVTSFRGPSLTFAIFGEFALPARHRGCPIAEVRWLLGWSISRAQSLYQRWRLSLAMTRQFIPMPRGQVPTGFLLQACYHLSCHLSLVCTLSMLLLLTRTSLSEGRHFNFTGNCN